MKKNLSPPRLSRRPYPRLLRRIQSHPPRPHRPVNGSRLPYRPLHRDWLLPDNAEDLSALSPADRKALAAAKAKLSRLLANHPTVTRLTRAVEPKLGIMRMVTIRRIQPPKNVGDDVGERRRRIQ